MNSLIVIYYSCENFLTLFPPPNRLRTMRAKKFGKKDTPKCATLSSLNGTPEKQEKKGGADDDDDEEKDEDDDEMSGGEDGGVGGADEEEAVDEEEVEVETADQGLEEIEKKIEKLSKVGCGTSVHTPSKCNSYANLASQIFRCWHVFNTYKSFAINLSFFKQRLFWEGSCLPQHVCNHYLWYGVFPLTLGE